MAKATVVAQPSPSQIRGQPTDDADSVWVTLDVVPDEQHEKTNTTTDNPVEEGADITDHVRPDPVRCTLHCIITNAPMTSQQQTQSDNAGTSVGVGAGVGAQAGAQTGTASNPRRDPARRGTAWAQLKAFMDNAVLLTVVTSLETYTDMIMDRLSVPVNAANGDALEFTAGFKKIRIVKNALTKVTRAKDTRAQGTRKKGHATTKPENPDDDKAPINKMIDGADGKKGLDALGGALGGLMH